MEHLYSNLIDKKKNPTKLHFHVRMSQKRADFVRNILKQFNINRADVWLYGVIAYMKKRAHICDCIFMGDYEVYYKKIKVPLMVKKRFKKGTACDKIYVYGKEASGRYIRFYYKDNNKTDDLEFKTINILRNKTCQKTLDEISLQVEDQLPT